MKLGYHSIYTVPIPRPRPRVASYARFQSHDVDIPPMAGQLILRQTYTPVHEDQTSQNYTEDTWQ